MQKLILSLLLIWMPIFLLAQAPTATELVQIHNVTTAERAAITDVQPGMLIYDTETEIIYTFTASHGWIPYLSQPTVYMGSFIVSKDGAQSISGLPFQPSQISFTAHANIETLSIDADNGLGNNARGLQNSYGNMNGFARDDAGSITQGVMFSGGHGNSINDISRYASSDHCITVRYGHQNGDDLGKITASLTKFDPDGFTITALYSNGTLTENSNNPINRIQPDDVVNEQIVVFYTAYR